MKKIAITGGIASGKSTVCRFLKELGAHVIDADDIVHQLLSFHSPIGKKVVALLGDDIVVNGELSREAIARKVFSDSVLLQQLEQILHPEVQRFIETRFNQLASEQPSIPLFVVEVPLLFESHLHLFYDATIAVTADKTLCKLRYNTRFPSNDFERRDARHLKEKEKFATYQIENNGSLEQLKQNVIQLFNSLTRR